MVKGLRRVTTRVSDRGGAADVRGFQAVDRALRVLEILGEDAEGYRLADLVVRTGLAASTLHRLLTALEQRRFTQFDRQTSTWHVGPQLFAIGSTFARRRNLIVATMPVLRSLRDYSRETTNLAVVDGGEIVVIAQVESREVVRAVSGVGGRAPVVNDALGKAILATYDDDEVAELIRLYGMRQVTKTSIIRAGAMRDELRDIQTKGYAVDRGEYIDELRCVAAAVLDMHGRAIAAISISGLMTRVSDLRLEELGRKVSDAAREITTAIGGRYPMARPATSLVDR